MLGINPIALELPPGDGPPIPFDADGNPTTKTAVALTDLLQTVGAEKGIGLAVIVAMLSSMLSGASTPRYGKSAARVRPSDLIAVTHRASSNTKRAFR